MFKQNGAELSDFLATSLESGVRWIELAKQPAHALSQGMISALSQTFKHANTDKATQVIVLIGPGRVFCAGHDMKEIRHHRDDTDEGLEYVSALLESCSDLMQIIALSSKPTIGVTEGVATAGGLQLLASCDIVFAAPSATFALPGVINGGFCTTPSVAVSRRIGPNATLEMSYSGEMFGVDWALQKGLVDRVVPQNELRAEVMEFAVKLAGRHMPAIFAGKDALHTYAGKTLKEAYAIATPIMLDHLMDPHRIAKDKKRW